MNMNPQVSLLFSFLLTNSGVDSHYDHEIHCLPDFRAGRFCREITLHSLADLVPMRQARENMIRDYDEWLLFMQRVSHLTIH